MYKYILASNKLPKIDCPSCHAIKHYQRYIDKTNGQALPAEFGKCDNIGKCGYECNPYKVGYRKSKLFIDSNQWKQNKVYKIFTKAKQIVDIPDAVLLHTLKNYNANTLVNYLYSKFNAVDVEKTLHLYFVGTCDKYITFPFISILGHCRAISLIEYSKIGKRVKTEPQARNIHTYLSFAYTAKGEALPTWLLNYKNSVNKFNCLFGEHLMNQFKHKPIAIVEAPKTAIIASMFYLCKHTRTNIQR
jgi:hypothetical protein